MSKQRHFRRDPRHGDPPPLPAQVEMLFPEAGGHLLRARRGRTWDRTVQAWNHELRQSRDKPLKSDRHLRSGDQTH